MDTLELERLGLQILYETARLRHPQKVHLRARVDRCDGADFGAAKKLNHQLQRE